MGSHVTIQKHCMVCGKSATTKVDRDSYFDWINGKLAQDAFPDLSAGEREKIISGTHPECFDQLYGEEM